MGTFLRSMERGLRFFGGTTKADIFDNMKTVVLSHTPTATVFNQRFLEYARTRHFAVVACNVRQGKREGAGRTADRFRGASVSGQAAAATLMDLNVKATAWRDTFANNRVHEVTARCRPLVFENEERRLLRPIGEVPFNTDDVESAGVTKSFRVRFDRNLYSVPPQLVGQSVVVRANDVAVAVFLGPTAGRDSPIAPGTLPRTSNTPRTAKPRSPRSLAPPPAVLPPDLAGTRCCRRELLQGARRRLALRPPGDRASHFPGRDLR